MTASRFRLATALALAAGLVLAGCSTAPGGDDAPGGDSPAAESPATAEGAATGDRPAELDAALPVPPGDLVATTQEASAWEFTYADITAEEAEAFVEQLESLGFDLKAGVTGKWYLQSGDWAVDLEHDAATGELLYWVDPIIE